MRTEYQEQAKVFKALCDPKRLSILEQLRSGEKVRLRLTRAIRFNAIWSFIPHENPL